MLQLILPVMALLLGVGLLLLGTGLLNTLLALRGVLEGYNEWTLGIIMSGYFAGFYVGTLAALPLIQRIGHIRTFAFSASLAACATLLHLLLIDPIAWLLLRVLTGASLVTLYTVVESWLNSQTPSEQRGRVFAIYMAVNLTALAAAQQLLHLDSASGFMLFLVAAMFITASLLPVTWTRMHQPPVISINRLKISVIFKLAPVAVAGASLSGLAMGAFWGMGAVYAGGIQLSDSGVALFMSGGIIGGALCQLPLGRLSDSQDRRKFLAVISGLAGLAALLLILLSPLNYWVLVAIALYGGMAFAIYPIAVAHLMDHLAPEDILSGGAALLLLHGLGAALGPALCGLLMSQFGPQALPLYLCAVQILLAGYTVRKLHERAIDPSEHPSHFVPMVRTSPTALEMLPEESGTGDLSERV